MSAKSAIGKRRAFGAIQKAVHRDRQTESRTAQAADDHSGRLADRQRQTYVWDADGCVVTGGLEQAEEPPKLFPIEPAEFKPAAQLVT